MLPTTSSVPVCYNTSPSTVCSSCNKSKYQLTLWHNRLGHPHSVILHQVLQRMNIHLGSAVAIPLSSSCKYGRLHQQTFPSVPQETAHPSQIIHTDVWGLSPFVSVAGYKYYVSLVDDYSRFVWIYPCRLK